MSDPKPRNYGEVPTTVENRSSAKDALKKSCYFKIDFGISEEATVYEAVQRFAAYNIGALAVTNADKKVIGIVSERDYVSKVGFVLLVPWLLNSTPPPPGWSCYAIWYSCT